uniref:Uncharacterized protein n=1 Tax=Pyxicephalus adspersus TaxID=30357 RepID=A0AAV3AQ92_PYXAD|nr:TPA: hypothetical protein GDO54_009012 [Pyxicephalus adspersus]
MPKSSNQWTLKIIYTTQMLYRRKSKLASLKINTFRVNLRWSKQQQAVLLVYSIMNYNYIGFWKNDNIYKQMFQLFTVQLL